MTMAPTLATAPVSLPPEEALAPRGGPAALESGSFAVGVIGTGNMGGGMAANLLAQGWPVHVHDVDPAKLTYFIKNGAVGHANAAQVAMQCIALIVCVVDDAQTASVLFGDGVDGAGAAAHLKPGSTVLLCPTIAPEAVEAFAQRLAELGVHCIDAPMSGGPARARDGSMSLMLAAPDAVMAANEALLVALSHRRFHVSQRPGDGARTKLVNNLLAGINLVGAAEALAMAQGMGLDLATTLDVIEQSSGQSWIGSDRMRRVLAHGGAGDYAPRAHMTLLAKDTRLAVAAAQAAGFTGPLGTQASAVFVAACEAGLAGEDDAALFKLLSPPPGHPVSQRISDALASGGDTPSGGQRPA